MLFPPCMAPKKLLKGLDMNATNVDFFSNLYVYYYYGSYTKCSHHWKELNITCPFSKLYYIRHGECELVIDGRIYHALPGQCYLIPAHTKHSYYHINDNHIEKYWMHFELKTGDEQALKSLQLPCFVTVPESETANLDAQFERIFQLAVYDDTASRLQEKAEILKLISTYIRLAQDSGYHAVSGNTAPSEHTFYDVIRYMQEHLSEKVTLQELADLMHVHPNYFIRMFKSYMGVPPLHYVNLLRIERAKSLLENTTLPVSSVMHQLGFDDISTFSSFFKHYTGYNPSAFRKAFSARQFQNR